MKIPLLHRCPVCGREDVPLDTYVETPPSNPRLMPHYSHPEIDGAGECKGSGKPPKDDSEHGKEFSRPADTNEVKP